MGKGHLLESRIGIKEISVVADLCEQIVLHRHDLQLINESFKSTYAKYYQTGMSNNLRNALTVLAQSINRFYSNKKRKLLLSDLFSLATSLRINYDANYKTTGDVLACAAYNAFFEWDSKNRSKKKLSAWEMNDLKRTIDRYWR